ncbi:MAG: helix-turn-helix transcriptional regulator [Clostridia bacterium]|nr:helix-turn-helix transcriptional regulator [Clostridia bacterium]MBR4458487.1 helix-turn-helix transcriptional regulator [Clostridia bacterium]
MPDNLYEIIRYETTNFKCVCGQSSAAMPHSHREIELGLILRGRPRLITPGADCLLRPGSLWLINPYETHAMRTRSIRAPYAFLALQLSMSFFRQYFPQAEYVRFGLTDLTPATVGEERHALLHSLLLKTARAYFAQEPYYALRTAGCINTLLAEVLEAVPHSVLTDLELRKDDARLARLQRLTDYIESHLGEKILLSDLAEREGLTLPYISQLFAREVGQPFQRYLTAMRCRRAAALLVETDQSLTDIAMACGFSALKYMTQGFRECYDCTPAELRASGIRVARRVEQDSHGPGSAELSRAQSLRWLEEQLKGETDDAKASAKPVDNPSKNSTIEGETEGAIK